jgi:hemerythrin-like domain-containing protein
MPRPTHLLKHEHRVIEQAMRALEGLCVRLELNEEIPVKALIQIFDFFQIYADRFHHEKEEMFLFPALRKAGIENENGPLSFLAEEHLTERNLLAELGAAITEYRQHSENAHLQIIELARNYSQHLLGHLLREDGILFTLAEEILDEATKTEIHQVFIESESALGTYSVSYYEKLACELEESWSV